MPDAANNVPGNRLPRQLILAPKQGEITFDVGSLARWLATGLVGHSPRAAK